MYKAFYNLKRNPFEITPDPFFLFPTRRHNEALAALYYGVRRHKGFVVMTGEVGTGKTLLVRCLLQLLNQSDVAYAYVFNSRLSPVEFLQYVAGDFGLNVSGKNKSELLLVLSNYVISRHQKKLTTVLVVDEAHHVSAEVLEEIRLLDEPRDDERKVAPDLAGRAAGVGREAGLHRVAAIEAENCPAFAAPAIGFGRNERLHPAPPATRWSELPMPTVLFPADTVVRVHRHSRGIPRLINTVCENALITAYARQARSVTPDIIEDIAADFRLGVVHQPKAGRRKR